MPDDIQTFNNWKWTRDTSTEGVTIWRCHPKASIRYLVVSTDGHRWEAFVSQGRVHKTIVPVTQKDSAAPVVGEYDYVTSICERHFFIQP